jgi:hypothetical protein
MHFRFVFALMLAVAVARPALAASAEHGKTAFIQNGCWQCHGMVGQGSTNRAMPPFSEKILSDGDLADIYAYLQSIPPPPDVASIPLLMP